MNRADLHIHTATSGDSTLAPEAIFEQAVAADLSAIAFTDHDCIVANDLGRQLAAQYGIEFLAGVELSCSWHSQLVHLLGYFPAGVGPTLHPFIIDAIASQARRNALTILERLRPLGLDVSVEEYDARAGEVDRRSALFRLAVEREFVTSKSEYKARIAMLQIEGVASGFPPVPAAVAAIHAAGGFAVLAHPFAGPEFYEFSEADIETLAGQGLDGIEVYHPNHMQEDLVQYYATIAGRLGLVATGGSDSHGRAAPTSRRYVSGMTCDWDVVRERLAKD